MALLSKLSSVPTHASLIDSINTICTNTVSSTDCNHNYSRALAHWGEL